MYKYKVRPVEAVTHEGQVWSKHRKTLFDFTLKQIRIYTI